MAGFVATTRGTGGVNIATTTSTADLSEAINAPGVTDMAYDGSDGLLYLSTYSGDVLRFDPVAGSFLAPIHVGGELSSVAVSPDGSFLLVGQKETATDIHGNVTVEIDRVNLSTSAVARLSFAPQNPFPSLVGGIADLAVASNGQAIFTNSSSYADGWGFLQQFTAASAAAKDAIVAGSYGFGSNPGQLISEPAYLATSEHARYVLVAETNISAAPLDLYDSKSGKVVASLQLTDGFNHGAADVNETAALVVAATTAGTDVYDLHLKLVKSLTALDDSLVTATRFTPDGKELLALDESHNELRIFDTKAWAEVSDISLADSGWSNYVASQKTAVSSDGRFAFIQTANGFDSIDLKSSPATAPTPPATVNTPAVFSSPLSLLAPAIDPNAPTIRVTGQYTVTSDQHLSFDETHAAGFTMSFPGDSSSAALGIDGSVSIASADDDVTLVGAVDFVSYPATSLIKVDAGGSLQVNASGSGSQAYGASHASADLSNFTVENDGTWTVSGAKLAIGVQGVANHTSDSVRPGFSNSGTFHISGDTAVGVAGESFDFKNTNDFSVSGKQAVGVDLDFYGLGTTFSNSGEFSVNADDGASVGVRITGFYNGTDIAPFSIENSGTITADKAVLVYNSHQVAFDQTPRVILENSGVINGEIDLGTGHPIYVSPGGLGSQIINSGKIYGAIHFDDGDVLYDGSRGSQSGGIYLGAGDDRVLLGDDGETVHGGSGRDTIVGGDGNDVVDGGAGETSFSYETAGAGVTVSLATSALQNTGGGGSDTLVHVSDLIGSKYADNLTASGMNQSLEGGAGNDTLVAGSGAESLDGGTGTDTAVISGSSSGYTVTQTAFGAHVSGSSGTYELRNIEVVRFDDEQVVQGAAGQTLTARAAGDTMVGGAGNDTFYVASGLDAINGAGGNDTAIFAGASSDFQLSLSDGVVTVLGSGETTTLTNVETLKFDDRSVNSATIGAVLIGTDGPEILTGGNNDDTLVGLGGNDTLKGGAGNDLLDGGTGNDTLNGGAGNDTATYADATGGVTVNLQLTNAQSTGGAGVDTLTQIENLIGSNFGDALTAGNGGSSLQGMGGDDTLASGAGNDTLDGGGGNNTASYALAAAGVTVSLAISGPQNTGSAGTDTLISIENLIGSKFADTFTPGSGAEAIDGGAGMDTAVYAGPSTDYAISSNGPATTVTGDGQSDSLTNVEVLQFADEQLVITGAGATFTGRAAGDTLVGGAGADKLTGGAGDDTLVGNGGNDSLNGGGGTNTAVFHGNFAGYTIKQNNGVTKVTGPDGSDSLQKIQILQFDDRQVVNGSAGTTVHARSGGDTLVGGAGADTLVGSSHADTLIGGAGKDTLTGGGGDDHFVFTALGDSPVKTPDLITDWASGDLIDLSAIDADSKTSGHQAFHIGATSGHTGDVVVQYDAAHGRTVIDLYVNSDNKADAEIWLSGDHHGLSVADFLL